VPALEPSVLNDGANDELLAEIEIVPHEQNEAGIFLSSDDSWSTSTPQEMVSIEPWELTVHDIGKNRSVLLTYSKRQAYAQSLARIISLHSAVFLSVCWS